MVAPSAFLALWIVINVVAVQANPFDPYPLFLFYLLLSMLAAIQAPVIMLSQNRQEAKDRDPWRVRNPDRLA